MRKRIEKLAMIADPTGKLWAYLSSSTFLTDLASIRNHGSTPGGLAFHSAEVFVNLHRISGESAQLCAMIALGHDLCKVGTYSKCMKNEKVKNPGGSSSMMRLIQASGTPIPKPVLLAIRWHMGAYGASAGEEWTRMGKAMTVDVLVIYTQTSDLLSTYRPMTEDEVLVYIERVADRVAEGAMR